MARNDEISSGYMFYQLFNLVGFIIGPGTIFLLLISASSLAFGLSDTNSLILNSALIGIFFLGCKQLEKEYQISLAQVNLKIVIVNTELKYFQFLVSDIPLFYYNGSSIHWYHHTNCRRWAIISFCTWFLLHFWIFYYCCLFPSSGMDKCVLSCYLSCHDSISVSANDNLCNF